MEDTVRKYEGHTIKQYEFWPEEPKRRRNWLRIGFVLVMVVLLCLSAGAAFAHHSGTHRVLTIGIPTEIAVGVHACTEYGDMEQVLLSHVEHGHRHASILFQIMEAQGKCGALQGPLTITEIYYNLEVEDGAGVTKSMTFVRFEMNGHTLYAGLSNVTVSATDSGV